MKKIIKLIRFIFDILLPPRCLICGEIVYKENGLCAKCFSKINFLSIITLKSLKIRNNKALILLFMVLNQQNINKSHILI